MSGEEILKQQVDRNVRAMLKVKGIVPPFQTDPEYLRKGASTLKATLGVHLAAYVCGLDSMNQLSKWIKGLEPNTFERNRLLAAIQVEEILSAKFNSKKEITGWLTTPNDYLGMGLLPMDEMYDGHSERVRKAALYLLA